MNTNKRKILDPVVIAKLSGMLLKARFVVEGFITGLHHSPHKGYSLEFAQHREYSPGDELKHLDWKVYAKTDRHYIKQYQEETNMKCYILLDKSASMGYKSNGVSKLDYATMAAASISYLALRQQDSVGLSIFDSGIVKHIPPRQGIQHLSVIMNELENVTASKTTGISAALQEMGGYVKKRGLVIVISDLFDNEEEVLKSLKHLRFKKNEIIVFHVMDKMELKLPPGESVLFEDIETGAKVLTEPDLIRKEYEKIINNFINNYRLSCRNSDIDYYHINTSDALDRVLGLYFAEREKLK